MAPLPRHPVTMEGFFSPCFLVNFAMPEASMRSLVPYPLRVEIYEGQAFLSIVIALVRGLKPRRLSFLPGTDAWHVVYRVPVAYRGRNGQLLRGVYFLRSDTESAHLRLLGNLLTHFRVHPAAVAAQVRSNGVTFRLRGRGAEPADITVEFDLDSCSDQLPPSSVFPSLDTAREFLVELFHAFGVLADGSIDVIPIARTAWDLQTVPADRTRFGWIERHTELGARLDSIFYADRISYRWFPAHREAPHGGLLSSHTIP